MAEGLDGVRARLRALVAQGSLQPDPLQARGAEALDAVLDNIRFYAPVPPRSGFLGRLLGRGEPSAPPRGLYLHGGVGRGKTMLMDMFFDAAPTGSKRRVHFNAFMADAHDRIGAQRAARKAGRAGADDPIPPVAAALAREAWLLCFDEFAVTDIADAMVLSRLFSALFAQGTVLVATSNVAPADLYRDGLNRALFTPFIGLLEARCAVLALDGPKDYRLERLKSLPVYATPLGADADRAMDAAWDAVTAGQAPRPAAVTVMGRTLAVPLAAGDAARFSFAQLCEAPLGARDFLALTERFGTFVIDRVPVLGENRRNEAKRFILLVDTLYDRGARLFLSAAATPENLYTGRTGTEAFEWARAASRLAEMQGAEWMEAWRERRESVPPTASRPDRITFT